MNETARNTRGIIHCPISTVPTTGAGLDIFFNHLNLSGKQYNLPSPQNNYIFSVMVTFLPQILLMEQCGCITQELNVNHGSGR